MASNIHRHDTYGVKEHRRAVLPSRMQRLSSGFRPSHFTITTMIDIRLPTGGLAAVLFVLWTARVRCLSKVRIKNEEQLMVINKGLNTVFETHIQASGSPYTNPTVIARRSCITCVHRYWSDPQSSLVSRLGERPAVW
ncbi:hypothetical protein EJ05DRAFT_367254 [Pseudovirgaria hyperparasitica]|uniref:Uncharacterized protein n=1 Tax=Pseudovirgaria hyperparasitica TaxID=470096 RepID=A0A6A6W4G2_9PEZI|nr:uncharacterized protein EJ05DRAFT_367254 [Pseudovirgaria hyperparasitica]KAF2757818.1 hypothetical protein EJ05DRAFT_367254 [Pseudovirgaria hyperparasitica]